MNFKDMTKKELEIWARENLDLELDRRLSKTKLVKQVEDLYPGDVSSPEPIEPVIEDVVEDVIVEEAVEEVVVVEVPVIENPIAEKVEVTSAAPASVSDAAAVEAFDAWVKSGRSRTTYIALREAVEGTSIEKAFKGWSVDRRSPNYRALVSKVEDAR